MRRWSMMAMWALAALTAGCALPAQEEARRIRDGAVPFELLDPQAPPLVPPPAGPSAEQVELCFVRDRRLVVVNHDLATPVSLRDPLDALASPPPDAGPSLRTAITQPSIVQEVRLLGGIAHVDFRPAVSALPTEEQLLAVAQIVCTLTARPGVGQVTFTLEGAGLAVPKGDGSLVTSPVARDDYVALLV